MIFCRSTTVLRQFSCLFQKITKFVLTLPLGDSVDLSQEVTNMQIKEVSTLTGLSIKTIRFYEERGLINPKTEFRNGRNYRSYGESEIEILNMVAVFRKCLFSLDQIKTMLDHPELTPDIFTEYRIGLLTQKELLLMLAEKIESLDPESLSSPEILARRLTTTANPLPLPTLDTDPHFGRFDPETPEQRQSAYLRWQRRYKHRHLRRWLPVAATLLVLVIITLIGANNHMNRNVEQFIYAKQMLEQDAVSFIHSTANSSAFTESGDHALYFFHHAVFGLYTDSGNLLSRNVTTEIPNSPEPAETTPDMLLSLLSHVFPADQEKLYPQLEEWISSQESTAIYIRSNVFSQILACSTPVELQGKPYSLTLYFHHSPLLYIMRQMLVWYIFAVFIWGAVFAFSTSKGYSFRVVFMRQYVGRGCWNDSIIQIDEETGESTVLTKGTAGMANLVSSRKKDKI